MANEKMPFTEHLGELRKRIIACLAGILIGFSVSFYFSERLFGLLTFPMNYDTAYKTTYPFIYFIAKGKTAGPLVFLAPAEAFWMHMKISLISGFILSLPLIAYHFWKFVSPGLLKKERKYAGPFIIATSGLFFLGAAFCFLVVLPFAIKFLLTYKTGSLTPMISVGNYMDFCLKFILAFGLIFELPLAIVFATRIGIISTATLAKNRKYAVLLAFVASAILTPTPDVFNQTLMAIPIILLYEGGLLISRFLARRKHKDG